MKKVFLACTLMVCTMFAFANGGVVEKELLKKSITTEITEQLSESVDFENISLVYKSAYFKKATCTFTIAVVEDGQYVGDLNVTIEIDNPGNANTDQAACDLIADLFGAIVSTMGGN